MTEVAGCFDDFRDGYAWGWAVNPEASNKPLTIGFFVDGDFVGSTVANVFRQDLASAGVSNGYSGFRFRIEPPQGCKNSFSVTAVVLDNNQKLQGGPKIVHQSADLIKSAFTTYSLGDLPFFRRAEFNTSKVSGVGN